MNQMSAPNLPAEGQHIEAVYLPHRERPPPPPPPDVPHPGAQDRLIEAPGIRQAGFA